jgi:hypothetical protein
VRPFSASAYGRFAAGGRITDNLPLKSVDLI